MSLDQSLAEVVGARHVLSDPDLKASYEHDFSGRYSGTARLVVRPGDTHEVAGVLAACASHGAAIVPQGGNTGLVGAGVPRDHEVLLSLQRLTEVGEVDPAIGQVTVGAGTTLASLQSVARGAGLDATLDFGARDSCTVGGVVACDAGGARALRHGTARAHVAGLEAVLADGTVVSRLAGLTKDNAGYDLPALLIGSEGTLGVITRVRWKLSPLLRSRVTALVPLAISRRGRRAAGLAAGQRALAGELRLLPRRRPPARARLPAARVPGHRARAVLRDHRVRRPVRSDRRARRGARTGRGRGRARRRRHRRPRGTVEAARGPRRGDQRCGDPAQARRGRAAGPARPVPRGGPRRGQRAGAERAILFGHLGDGNVHVNVLGADPDDSRSDDAVLELVLECGGTISAEHGVGVSKARWLERARGTDEVAAMRASSARSTPRTS